jgi:colicin import membrane protein
MGRLTQLTESEVFGVIRALLDDGSYPTAAAVRERLGGRGSPVVLQRFLADWYREHGPLLAQKASTHRPAASGLRAHLHALTQEAMAEVDAAQASRVAELDRRHAELDEREARLLALTADLEARSRQLEDRGSAQLEMLNQLKDQLSQAFTGLKDLADLRVELVTTREARDHSQSLLVARTQERDLALTSRSQLEAALRHAHDDLALGHAAHTEALVSLANAREQLAEQQALYRSHQTALVERNAAVAALEARLAAESASRREAEVALANLTGRHAALLQERDGLTSAHSLRRQAPKAGKSSASAQRGPKP